MLSTLHGIICVYKFNDTDMLVGILGPRKIA